MGTTAAWSRRFGYGILTAAVLTGAAHAQEKVAQLPIRTDGPKSLDPVQGSTTYDNMACAQMFETLLIAKYADPMNKEPLLLAEMPERLEDGKLYRFKLKDGVTFHDDACFPGGKGREVVTDDVFYSLKRLADDQYEFENWWLLKDTVVGLNEFKENANDGNPETPADYSMPVEGFRKISDKEFEIELIAPVTRFEWVLTMFQTSIVPREAVEYYGEDFFRNPVGTGPFMLESWTPKKDMTVVRNPNYHEVRYPARDEWTRDDRRAGLHRPAGQRVPFLDKIEFTMFPQDQPMWLQFEAGNMGYTQMPDEYFPQAFDKRTKELLPEMAAKGVRGHANKLLDFIFRGFNMEDPIVGGYTPDKKALRQAISLAMDLNEFNETFYSGLNVVYDGPIPPGLDGHPEGGRTPKAYQGPNLELARQKLAEAGYPNGEGLDPIDYYANRGGNSPEQTELMERQLARIGVKLNVQLVDFSTLIDTVNKKNAQMFSFAWSSDYPDAENNLALFYGPNESPGSNHYNYKRAEYDEMYEQILSMPNGSERTEIMIKMRDMLLEDVPYIGSMARERHYAINPWLLNCKPTERYYGWFKFLDVDDSKR
ncbi:MAG: ABC transporter substrate-binding protein [Phycisphaerales bacterium]